MKKPNFFIVGQAKSGTTALANFLNQHPEIFIPEIKETNFFAKDLLREIDTFEKNDKKFFKIDLKRFKNEKEYLSLFKAVEKEKLLGEASTSYIYSKIAAKEIKKFDSNSKIIVLLREPVDFLISLYQQNSLGREPAKTFEKALKLERKRKKGVYDRGLIPPISLMFYSERIKYADQIKRYFNLFGEKNVLVLIYEDYKKNNYDACKKIFKFLKVDPRFIPKTFEKNASKSLRSRKLGLLWRNPLLRPTKEFLKKILPQKISKNFLKIYSKTLFKEEKVEISPLLREDLKKKFKLEVEKVGKLIKKDLSKKWGYT